MLVKAHLGSILSEPENKEERDRTLEYREGLTPHPYIPEWFYSPADGWLWKLQTKEEPLHFAMIFQLLPRTTIAKKPFNDMHSRQSYLKVL